LVGRLRQVATNAADRGTVWQVVADRGGAWCRSADTRTPPAATITVPFSLQRRAGGGRIARVQMPKPTDGDRDRFRALVAEDPRVEVKPMFGQLAAFVNGNMFFGLFGSDLGVKLGPDELAKLHEAGGGPFGPSQRPMAGYATVPDDDAAAWISKALDYVAALPSEEAEEEVGAAVLNRNPDVDAWFTGCRIPRHSWRLSRDIVGT